MISPAASPLRLDIAAVTDKGLKRSANEDAYGLFDLPGTDAAIVVADGMGGLQAGDVASEETVSVIEETLRERNGAGDTPGDALREAFIRANTRVFAIAETVRKGVEDAARQAEADMPTAKRGDYSKSAPHPKSSTPLMGATAVAVLLRGAELTVAHAGDSRLYRLRENKLEALTFDHSFVAERVRSGDISESEARVSRFRNMITRAIGIDDTVVPEIQTLTVVPGDTYLLCTDGLNTMLGDDEIGDIAAQTAPAQTLAAQLVDAANKRGGSDNITVVVVRALGADAAPAVVTAPVAKASATGRAAPASLPEVRPAPGANRPPIVDMEPTTGGSRRAGASPFVSFLAFLGIITLGIGALIAASADVRQNIGRFLAPPKASAPAIPGKPAQTLTSNTIRIKDYARMTYKPAVPFGEKTFALRGDLLAYSPKTGIYFVTDALGQLIYMNRAGKVIQQIGEEIPQPPPVGNPVPPSRVFYAVDLQGNTYFSYPANKEILKYNTKGVLIGKIPGTERPEALTVDEDGNLYVIYDSQLKKIEAVPMTPAKPQPPAP